MTDDTASIAASAKLDATFPLVDWRIADGDPAPDDLPTETLRAPWRLRIEKDAAGQACLTATAPNGTKRTVMIELDRGMLAVRCYLDEAQLDEPTSILLSDDKAYIVPASRAAAEHTRLVGRYPPAIAHALPSDIPAATLAPAAG
ncbi:MAG TPA: hypothetical protein P5256_00380 [Beijerinckiaceae bacterium]|nr:hypothetical protein [Rhodoblastus sp.]MCC2107218.1 hypothetical protein [Hyphomicrobiales bacterium]HPG01763.1 hypothetical protein [Rhodoblastus sp.]HRY01552.1 hypothetical protein [Beijerinckiaceae bacterium]